MQTNENRLTCTVLSTAECGDGASLLTDCTLTLFVHAEHTASLGPSGVIWKSTYHHLECSFMPPSGVQLSRFNPKQEQTITHSGRQSLVGHFSPAEPVSMTKRSFTLEMPSVSVMMWSVAEWNPSVTVTAQSFCVLGHYLTREQGLVSKSLILLVTEARFSHATLSSSVFCVFLLFWLCSQSFI